MHIHSPSSRLPRDYLAGHRKNKLSSEIGFSEMYREQTNRKTALDFGLRTSAKPRAGWLADTPQGILIVLWLSLSSCGRKLKPQDLLKPINENSGSRQYSLSHPSAGLDLIVASSQKISTSRTTPPSRKPESISFRG